MAIKYQGETVSYIFCNYHSTLSFTFRFLGHLESIFVYVLRWGAGFISIYQIFFLTTHGARTLFSPKEANLHSYSLCMSVPSRSYSPDKQYYEMIGKW